jgi:segregation and condensation protein A
LGEGRSEGERGPEGEGSEAFRLALPRFEGPLDLLLHLIERNELDVTEVSLVQVTEQYLQHLRAQEQLNLAALADFIAIGARLLLLKSRALLAPEEEPARGEDETSAEDLVEALREYRRFKEAAEFFRARESGHAAYGREAPPPQTPLPTGLDTVTLDSLVDLIREILERMPEEEPAPEVQRDPIRLRDRMGSLVESLERDRRLSFRRLIESATSRTMVVVDFLAVLELIKSRYLEARQSESFGDIDLVRREDAQVPDLGTLAGDFRGA